MLLGILQRQQCSHLKAMYLLSVSAKQLNLKQSYSYCTEVTKPQYNLKKEQKRKKIKGMWYCGTKVKG